MDGWNTIVSFRGVWAYIQPQTLTFGESMLQGGPRTSRIEVKQLQLSI